GLKRIEGRAWGVVMPMSEKGGLFSFAAPLSASSANMYWLGTRGVPDTRVDVKIPSFFGQVSIWLRSDYKKGQGVGVGFSRKEIFVDQVEGGVRQRLARIPWSAPSDSISGQITLEGSSLLVNIDGSSPMTVKLKKAIPSPDGFIRLQVFDRVRGAARADFVNL